jgi:hypothetical protein
MKPEMNIEEIAADFPELMTTVQAAALYKELTGYGKESTWRRERCVGGGCPWVRVGPYVRYRRADVIDFARSKISQTYSNTTQYRHNGRRRRNREDASSQPLST